MSGHPKARGWGDAAGFVDFRLYLYEVSATAKKRLLQKSGSKSLYKGFETVRHRILAGVTKANDPCFPA
jgi:hypothetical protein